MTDEKKSRSNSMWLQRHQNLISTAADTLLNPWKQV